MKISFHLNARLPFDCPNLRIIGVNYESALSEWSAKHTCPCEKIGTLKNRSDELMNSLAASGVGRDRPIVWGEELMFNMIYQKLYFFIYFASWPFNGWSFSKGNNCSSDERC